MDAKQINEILEKSKGEIDQYLKKARDEGRIDNQLFTDAKSHVFENLKLWLECPQVDGISLAFKDKIAEEIQKRKYDRIINAFRQEVRFGTGGIRGMMAFDKSSILKLKKEGLGAAILKGPNTINDLVVMKTTAGVAKYGNSRNPRLEKVVIGYDRRIRGFDLAQAVASVFLAYGFTVYFFDAPCPYPEVTFAIPHESIKADIGVLISASHNDYRYNGYKLSCANGSQFDPEERDEMYNKYIENVTFSDIKATSFTDAAEGKLWFLGGKEPVKEFDYCGKEKYLLDIHSKHLDHIKSFLMTDDLPERQQDPARALHIGYCPFHGAGAIPVYRLLNDVGFRDVLKINGEHRLYKMDGMFPAFNSAPGQEQQPDPGDPRSADTAVKAFKHDHKNRYKDLDIIIGTDPDADRCGIIVKVPEAQRAIYDAKRKKDYYLLPADDVWTLVLWYRLYREAEKYGKVKDPDKKFVVLSHTTTDAVTYLCRKYGIGVVKSWVGFAALAAVTRDIWSGGDNAGRFAELVDGRDTKIVDGRKNYIDICHPFVCESFDIDNGKREQNIAAMEQSNGFSILGGRPKDASSLGRDGHVRDKDGTFAALLVAEIAAWAKDQGMSLIELLDKHIYLDPDIGMFATFYEPDPLDGEYPGIEGDRIKKKILRRAHGLYQFAMAGDLEFAGIKVTGAAVYRTGKYDRIYPPEHDYTFPDEGIRFFLGDDSRRQHITIRPSGTGNSLRFHIQLHAFPKKANLLKTKAHIRAKGREIMDEIRDRLKAPRK